MTLRDDVREHVTRLGLEREYLTDATSRYTITLASQMIAVVEAAMEDVGIDEQRRRQVLDRVLYGTMPSRADAEQRQQLAEVRAGALRDLGRPVVLGGGGGTTDVGVSVATGTNAGGSGRMVFDPESRTWLGGGGGVPDGGSPVATDSDGPR